MNRILCLKRFYWEVWLDWQFEVFYPLSRPSIADISSWLCSFEFSDWVSAALIAKHLAICVDSRCFHLNSSKYCISAYCVQCICYALLENSDDTTCYLRI